MRLVYRWSAALLACIPGVAAAAPVELPARLVAATRGAAHAVETVEVGGLIDRRDARVLHVPQAAFDAARDDGERTALLAMSLSYKLGAPVPAGSPGRDVGRAVASLVGAAAEDEVAARDRRDPYLKLPAAPQLRRRAPGGREPATATDPRALRGLAWASAAGVCEATTVAYLRGLAGQAGDAAVADDARTMLKGLGMIGFTPDESCLRG